MKLNTEIKGQGYPVLCLHGHPGCIASMSVFTNYLSQQYQTITPDLRGYGKSRYQQNFAMQDHLTDLIALLDQHQIEQCLVLGWSLGGIIAMELALAQPTRFSGLILIATAAHPLSSHPRETWQDLLFTGIGGIANYLKPAWQWNIDTFCKRSLFRYLIQNHKPEVYHYLAKEAVPAYLQTSKAAQNALFTAIRQGYNRLEHLDQIKIPCLMLSGECDRHIIPFASQKTAEHLSNCAYKNYPQVAHLFPWEIPDLVLADIQQWLDRYTPTN
ncbi:MAG: alpha/beta hydrolase [Pleurocapsa minor HA4230-MV1]|jgi:proline iminopeptidase|nr:alpha/beta hydrolase [Pleurocapsa minor HA4230-MV1]